MTERMSPKGQDDCHANSQENKERIRYGGNRLGLVYMEHTERKGNKRRKRRTFDEWLTDARTYRKRYGDLLVPCDYVTAEGNRLGRWIERKRGQYNGVKSIHGQLYADEIAALEAIGMVWKLEHRFPWEEWICQADQYYHTYGHLNVPKEYAIGPYRLGYWLIEQRQKYASGQLSSMQIRELEKFQMRWEMSRPRSWNEWYEIARIYYERHGDLRVPANYTTKEGIRLGRWICSQRDCYHERPGKRRLTSAEIEKLDGIGMVWSIAQEQDLYWQRMLECAKAYVAEHHRLPPRISEKVMTADGNDLTNWVRAQQDRYRQGLLKEERVAALKAAGIVGRREGKESRRSDDGSNMGERIRTLRVLLKLSPEKVAEDLHISEKDYMEAETGKKDMPLGMAMRIASYYRLSLVYLAQGRWTASKSVHTQESAAILSMLRRSETKKREHAIKMLEEYLT